MNLIDQYIKGRRIPWSPGYAKFKHKLMVETLADPEMMRRFATTAPLPAGFAPHIDERAVEVPWCLARLGRSSGRVLDAGSVLNSDFILDQPRLKSRDMVIWSLVIDQFLLRRNLSYVHGDFRAPILRPESFETIVCISTIEHVGLWPIPSPPFAESLAKPQPQKDLFGYRGALQTFKELLVPGGHLLVTVPFGKKEDQDWLQVFDEAGVDDIAASFGGQVAEKAFYRTSPEGWQVATPSECADSRYYNFVKQPDRDPDMPAAARAVACLDLVK
ncbi:MAG: hypothetical protein NVV74_04815 [Magnetospirillum sp.]|nr:hypothetical protein [Magnetospirillum sp.]